MPWPRVGGAVRRWVIAAFFFLAISTVALWLLLPYDNALLLWFRFVGLKIFGLLRTPLAGQGWRTKSRPFDVDFAKDVAVIIKTGYGTQQRVPAQLTALAGMIGHGAYDNTIVIADFGGGFSHNGVSVAVHDVVATVALDPSFAEQERVVKYKSMIETIATGSAEEAQKIGKSVGWELDAMKFIPGLDLAYQRIPDKKWYIMLDDDTYMLEPSLRMILGQLDPSKPFYLGNPIGDYKGRFAHGGSSIILSWAAMSRLFDQHRDLIPVASADSLTETWGDKLVATTLMKVGVYLDEQYSHFFNGERPLITQIFANRFCSPIVSFHGLAEPSQMEEVGRLFEHVDTAVSWGQLWKLYSQPDLAEFAKSPIRQDEDHVGRTDESTMTIESVDSAQKCLENCDTHYKTCLAWTWDAEKAACHLGPWMIIGVKSPGKFSGLNVGRLHSLAAGCAT